MSLNRRNFIAGSAALASAPALGAVSASGETDVAIVGAGAAGIAAARKVAAAGRRFALIEASDRVGGRCVTDTRTFGVPFDRGAHWVHLPDINPLAKLAAARASTSIRRRRARSCASASATRAKARWRIISRPLVRANRAIQEAARGKADVACMQALPKDLGEWRPAVEFVLGPFGCGKNLDEISAVDFARSLERDVDAFCRQGFGALLAKLAADLPVQLKAPVHAHAVDAQLRRDRNGARASSWRAPPSSRSRPACSRAEQDQVRRPSCRSAIATRSPSSRSAPTTMSRWS